MQLILYALVHVFYMTSAFQPLVVADVCYISMFCGGYIYIGVCTV